MTVLPPVGYFPDGPQREEHLALLASMDLTPEDVLRSLEAGDVLDFDDTQEQHKERQKQTLFSYCLRYDLGSAPNPFWGLCTLAICKPRIRQAAQVGDWVVGTGSAASLLRNNHTSVVYAMRVTEKLTMKEYDQFTRAHLPEKMPRPTSKDHRRRGDSIYDFSVTPPALRPGVHTEVNRSTDLAGEYVLLSNHFFYFGDQPVELPETLQGIVKQGPGHKSNFSPVVVEAFIEWIQGLGYPLGTLLGKPHLWEGEEEYASSAGCGLRDRKEAEGDLEEPDDPTYLLL